jgi:PhnB protein
MPMPDGKLMHAELKLGDSRLMLADEFREMGAQAPSAYGGSPVTVHLYVPDVDATVARAEAAGAKVTSPPADMFWGDRFAKLSDPFGHQWSIATHLREPSPEEFAAAMKRMGGG